MAWKNTSNTKSNAKKEHWNQKHYVKYFETKIVWFLKVVLIQDYQQMILGRILCFVSERRLMNRFYLICRNLAVIPIFSYQTI